MPKDLLQFKEKVNQNFWPFSTDGSLYFGENIRGTLFNFFTYFLIIKISVHPHLSIFLEPIPIEIGSVTLLAAGRHYPAIPRGQLSYA